MPLDLTRSTISHPKCFDLNSGKTSISKTNVSIEQSLRLLLTTAKGELLGDPFYGTNTLAYINEPNDLVLRDEIIDDYITAINAYEKRVVVGEEDIVITQTDSKVDISITYYMKELGKTGTFELSMLRGDYNGNQQFGEQ